MNPARAQISLLPDGRRLHLNDGPIDLIIEAFGSPHQIRQAYRSAAARFAEVLDELCAELPILRHAAGPNSEHPIGVIANRMRDAVLPYAEQTFVTPMAAVAGAVAEEILGAMTNAADLDRAYVNNGGDIAIHLAAGQQLALGLVEHCEYPALFGTAILDAQQPVRGIATSGWRGRSFSLGIADAVTILADRAAMADAAATIVANAVDLPGHPGIQRVRACDLAPDTDLGTRFVTQAVGALSESDIATALDAGEQMASSLLSRGLIRAAALRLQGKSRVVGSIPKGAVASSTQERDLVHA